MKKQNSFIYVSISKEDKKLIRFVSGKFGVSMNQFIKFHSLQKAREIYNNLLKKPENSKLILKESF